MSDLVIFVPEYFLDGGAGLSRGHPLPNPAGGSPLVLPDLLNQLAARVAAPPADTTALAALTSTQRQNGLRALVLADNSDWRFDAASTAVAGANVVVPADSPTTGRWVRLVPGTGASTVVGAPVADVTALQAITSGNRSDGEIITLTSDQSQWQFLAASTAAAVAGLVVVPDSGTGRWLRVDLADVAIQANVADLTALKAIATAGRFNGMFAVLQSNGSKWRFVSASSLTGDDMLVATPAAGSGRWIRADRIVDLSLAVTFSTADAAVLFTTPTGFVLGVEVPFHEVTTSWTGGTSAAIGLSSNNTGLSTKGDLLGGATGDVQATLVSTGPFSKGTKGAKIGTPAAILTAGNTIRFDRITDAFTAGAGNAHVPVCVLASP